MHARGIQRPLLLLALLLLRLLALRRARLRRATPRLHERHARQKHRLPTLQHNGLAAATLKATGGLLQRRRAGLACGNGHQLHARRHLQVKRTGRLRYWSWQTGRTGRGADQTVYQGKMAGCLRQH